MTKDTIISIQAQQIQALKDKNKGLLEQAKRERQALLDMTNLLDEHPEGYEGPCSCKLCQSYF